MAVKLECLMRTEAARHVNNSLVNQTIAALYQHPQSRDHVVGWSLVRSGQLRCSEVHLSTSAQHKSWHHSSHNALANRTHELASQHNDSKAVARGDDVVPVQCPWEQQCSRVDGMLAQVLGLTTQFIPECGGDVSGYIAIVTSTWCRSIDCIAELKASVQDAKPQQLLCRR